MTSTDVTKDKNLSRFRTYQVVLAAALVTYGIDFGFGLVLEASLLELTLWLVMLGVISFILWQMAKNQRLPRRGELIGYIIITTNAFLEFVLGLVTKSDLTAVLLNVGIWLLVLYGFAFFVFESRRGLHVALTVSVTSFLFCLPMIILRDMASPAEVYTLLKFYCANFFVITFGYAAAVWRENYERVRTDAEIAEQLALTDSLTNIYNRRGLEMLLEKEATRSERYGRDLSMILFDLDNFKIINDTHGHVVGDEVLKKVADIAQAHLRKGDELGRWGGEEFMVVCSETDIAQAECVAERLRLAITNGLWNGLNVTASFGVASRQTGELVSALYERTDGALYAAKHAGKNCTKVASTKNAPTTEEAIVS